MKIKTNDKVKIITGKDNGKSGKITKALPGVSKVVVEGLNVFTKHIKSGRGGAGQKIKVSVPVDVSNVALICPNCNKETRVGYMTLDNGKKYRVCKKCNQSVETKAKDK